MDVLSRFSLRNRALTALLTIFLVIAGGWATGTLKRELIPSIQFPIIAVITPVPGANAAVVEDRVTKATETAVLGLRGVEKVESSSSDSLSTVLVTLKYGTDLGQAQTDAQRALLNLQDLPEGAEAQVMAGSFDDFPIINMSVSGGRDQAELLSVVNRQMIPKIEDIEGVRAVQVSGVADQIVHIKVDPRKMAAAGVEPGTLADLLDDNGVLIPAGQVKDGESDLSVQVGSQLTSLEQLRSLPLPTEAPGTATAGQGTTAQGTTAQGAAAPTTPAQPAAPKEVTLGDIATVTMKDGDTGGLSRTDGVPSLTLAITKSPDGNTVGISHDLEDLRPDLEALVDGGKTQVVSDQAPFIEESIKDLGTEGLLGLLFAVLVVFLFLMSLRMTLVTAVSIPLSLLIAMLGLKIGGFTLNILTLGALTIAIGRVVDDSIVVVENIQRHLAMGETKRRAIPAGVREVASAVTASTMATVAVFLPLGLVGGQVGELFRPFALTVTLSMLASLFVSLTIIPVLCWWFLKARAVPATVPAVDPATATEESLEGDRIRLREEAEPVTRMQRAYLPSLRWAIARPLIALGLGVLVLVGSGIAAAFLKTDFIGSAGGTTVMVQQKLPAGTSIAQTDKAAKILEKDLADREGVESYNVSIGGSGVEAAMFGAGSNVATFMVTTDEKSLETVVDGIREFTDSRDDLGTVTVSNANAGPGASEAEIVVQAPDEAKLRTAAKALTAEMAKVEGARDVTNDLAELVPTVEVTVDRAKARALGLSETAVGGVVASALRGRDLGEVTIDGSGHNVRLTQAAEPEDVADLKKLVVGQQGARPVPLSKVATVTQVRKPATLTRTDGARSASITATPTADDLGKVTSALNRIVADTKLPAGATAKVGGVSADQGEAFGQLGLALLVAIAITYAVLVATFRSLIQPLILMLSVPFAATGAILLSLITDTPLGVASMIGLLMLIGIVVTNAIVLIDLVNQYRERGLSVPEALLEGGRHRLRPIIMTALATVLALTPMAMALTGGGAFISQPLAIVVIGGLITSTLLTLLLVPALYSLVEGWRERRGRGLRTVEEF